MEKTNTEILNNIATQLEQSTNTGWTSGYLDDWADHAKKMKQMIKTTVPLLKIVTENLSKKEVTAALHPNDKEVDEWIKDNLSEGDTSSTIAIFKFRLWLKDRELESKKDS